MLRSLALVSMLLSAGQVQAAPTTMLVVTVGIYANAIGSVQFTSLADCDSAAEHLSKLRTPSGSTIGTPGTWKSNREGGGWEPNMSFVCIPPTSEIPGLAEVLRQKGWYAK
jgi:hypothetical protein